MGRIGAVLSWSWFYGIELPRSSSLILNFWGEKPLPEFSKSVILKESLSLAKVVDCITSTSAFDLS